MKVIHRVFFNVKKHFGLMDKFLNMGIKVKEIRDKNFLYAGYFDISENNPLWDEVYQNLEVEGLQHTATSINFTQKEIQSAEWIYIGPDYICGYPMPDDDAGFKEISFTGDKQCKSCGIGLEQKAPIYLKGEPKLGKNNFMSIFWTYSIFAENNVFEILEQNNITGYEPVPAIHHQKNINLKNIMQLSVSQKLDMSIVDNNLVRDKNKCDHLKYNMLTRGMMVFPRQAFKDMPDFVQTRDWFGSGHEAFRMVLASAKFVELYLKNKWKGLSLSPIKII